MKNKKGQGLSLNTIIIAAIVLVVLIVLWAIFTGRMGKFTEEVNVRDLESRAEAQNIGRTSCNVCFATPGIDASGKPGIFKVKGVVSNARCPDDQKEVPGSGSFSDVPSGKYCCIKKSPTGNEGGCQ